MLLAVVIIFWPQSSEPGKIASKPMDKSLSELYDEASRDLSKGKYGSAANAFRQLLKIDPKYRDSSSKLKQATKALYKQAQADIKNGDVKAAEKKLEEVLANDPGNEDAQDNLDEINDTVGQDQGSLPKSIPADATPFDLLVGEINGYRTAQNGWLDKPFQAGSTYLPGNLATAKQIDRVLTTIAKYDSAARAKERLNNEKALFPVGGRDVTVNNHQAYFGHYEESRPDRFPILVSLAWARDNWVFIIQIIPTIDDDNNPPTQPSTDYKLGIAKDVAEQLGY